MNETIVNGVKLNSFFNMNATTTKDKRSWEGCTTKQQSISILKKRKLLLLLNIPSPLFNVGI